MNAGFTRRAAFGTPDRIRALMSAWCGGPLRPREIADLIGVPRSHDALHQAIHRAVEEGVLMKVGRALYASGGAGVRRETKGEE